MEIINFIWIGISLVVAFLLIRWWTVTYNKFIYWITRARRKFADIEVIMQQRVDMISALAQTVKKYDIHEYKTLKNVIEARSRWSKDADINKKVKAAQEIENNFFKLQAVFERYPKLKAEILHRNLMGRGSLSRIESRLRNARLGYNRVAQGYNERVKRFPRNIVAKVHGFKELDYLQFPGQEPYKPKEIFEE
jgi:LemA protein